MNKDFQSNERALIEYFGIEFGFLVHDNMRVHKLEISVSTMLVAFFEFF